MPFPIFSALFSKNLQDFPAGTRFNLAGLVNASPERYFLTRQNCVLFRIPLITHDDVQILCQVWCESREQEPRYNEDWKILQLTLIRGAVFEKKVDSSGIEVYVFSVNISNRKNRFIWISDPNPLFWRRAEPVKSEGSCFGERVPEKDRKFFIYPTIGGLSFSGWWAIMLNYRRKLTSTEWKLFMNLYRGRIAPRYFGLKMVDNVFVQNPDSGQDLLFHRSVNFRRYFQNCRRICFNGL